MYWLPKTLILDDPYFTECDITIDWNKYTSLDILGRKPYDHQRTGVEFLACRSGAILADDMGLGKCYQSIVSSLEIRAKKVLIVCPASVKITWQRELEYFGEKSSIVYGSRWPYVQKYTIINYDILKNFHTIGPQTKDENGNLNTHHRHLVNENYDLIIVDEAHKVKDHKSQRGQIINELVLKYGIDKVWLLTGTPIANRPMDFYNLLKLISSPLSDNWKFFAQRYCDAKSWWKPLPNGRRRQIWVTKGASNLDELAIRTKNILLRRMKDEIEDMPDKTITTNYYNLSKRGIKEYEGLWDDYVERKLEDGKRVRPLTRDLVELGLLRKFIAMETIPHTIELAKNAVEQGQKVVIFTTFTDELNEISDNFGNECVTHNGKMSTKNKQISIDKFQTNDKVKVFVGNIASAGVGITLTEGTIVIFNSFDWVPGNNEQAEDRCYRIGQKNNVTVYYQLFTGTISLVMWYVLMKKQDVINKIIGTGSDDGKRLKMLMDDLEENGLTLE
jgi:SWI/SNF-related matrix-associated actin-dependent regulator 1 of chromatin subfamily A